MLMIELSFSACGLSSKICKVKIGLCSLTIVGIYKESNVQALWIFKVEIKKLRKIKEQLYQFHSTKEHHNCSKSSTLGV
jgi:hypothetical protein